MDCPSCGQHNPPTFHFCPSCGIALPTVRASETETETGAAADGRESPIGKIAEAGPSPLVADPPLAGASPALAAGPRPFVAEPRARALAERRLVSVLFLDLVGFTTLSESLDPEDVREIQSRYFEAARSTVVHYGGSLEKFIGDAVMAVWGTPVAHEDDGERAVRTALEVVADVAGIAVPGSGHLTARAAVATGEAAVTLDAEGQGMVTGDLVNTASRLQDAAEPGTVLVDAATRNVVGGAIALEPAGELQLKGRAAPVAAWRAQGVAGQLSSEARAGHRGPFVGRDAELRALRDLLAAVQAEHRMRVVSLVGVAGIGKSRLVWELEHLTPEGTAAPAVWFAGRAPGYGEGIAFAPLAEMLRRAAGIVERDPVEVARRSLDETLGRVVPDAAEREWMAPRLLALLEPTQADETQREELFAAWRRFFEAMTDEACVVLLFEDLQWADAVLLEFIDYLADWSRHRAILVLTLGRPELLDARPTWGAGLPHFTAMHLERLPDSAIDELLTALAPGLPRDAAREIRTRADGVPLFAVEMARMLIEAGGVAAEAGGQLAIEIPDSLHALLAARIDALPPPERSLLLTGAVLGRRFRPEALGAVSGTDPAVLRGQLRALIRREFLAMDDDPRSPGRGQLSFVQELVREVAYNTLSRRERRAQHLAVVGYLEAVGEDDLAEPIAEHLVAAHATTPGDQPEAVILADRARVALQHAAERAEALHAPQRALSHLERALALTDDPSLRAGLAESAGLAARAAAQFTSAERHLREAIDLREHGTDAAAAARLRARLASLLLQAQRSDTALAELESAWSVISSRSDTAAGEVEVPAELARAYLLRGDAERAVEWAERAIAAAEASGTRPSGTRRAVAIDARVTLGTARAGDGALDAGMAQLRQAIADAEEAGLGSVELRAVNNLAWLTVADDPRATSEMARHGLELAERLGIREMTLQLLDVASVVAVEIGDWDWALTALVAAASPAMPTSYQLDFAATRTILNAMRGEPDPSSPIDGLGTLEPDLDPEAVGWVDHARAWLSFMSGDLRRAVELARTSARQTVGYERWASLCLAGRAAAWSGDAEAAGEVLAEMEAEPTWGPGGRAAEAGRQNLRALVMSARSAKRIDAAGDLWAASLVTWRNLRLPLREALHHLDRWRLAAEEEDRRAAEVVIDQLGAAALRPLLGRG